MSKEDLEQKKLAIQGRFDELSKFKTDTEDEMKRLQGQFALVEELLAPAPPAENVDQADPAPSKRLRKIEVTQDAED